MNNSYKRKKEPVANRQLIMEAAIELAGTLEFNQITFDALSKICGLSKGGIMHHFPNKEALLDALFNESLDEFTGWIKEELEQSATSSPALAYLKVTIRHSQHEKYRQLMKVMFKSFINNERYCIRWKKWYSENILQDVNDENELATLLTALVTDGIWYTDILGFYSIDQKQKERLLDIIGSVS